MSEQFTYTGDLDDPRQQLRFLIDDTDSKLPFYSDTELDWFIDEWMPKYDSIYYVAAVAADKLAVRFASMPDVSADGVSVSLSSMARQYRELAQSLRETHKAYQIGGEVDLSNIMVGQTWDRSIRPLRFSWGLHDNPRAGNQDYGGITADPWSGEAERGEFEWGYY